jgi:hypothetical protein
MPPCNCQSKYKFTLTTSDGTKLEFATESEAQSAKARYGGAVKRKMA